MLVSKTGGHPVTFIAPGGSMHIRMMDHTAHSMIEAAKTLKARYFVTQDGVDEVNNVPIWAVFDANRAEKFMNEWKLPVSIREFHTETDDGAVMYAASLGRR